MVRRVEAFNLKMVDSSFSLFSFSDPLTADDLTYLFGQPHIVSNQFNDLDRQFSADLLELWVYFAKNGRMPKLAGGSEWPAQNKHHSAPRYVEINGRFLREWKFEFEERCDKFWAPLLNLYKR